MAVGSTGILKYCRPVGSSSSLTTPTLPDPDGPLSERVPAKAIELANAEVKQSQESSHGRRLPHGHCSLHYKGNLGLVFSIFAPQFVLIRQSFTVGPLLASGGLNFCLIFQVGDSPKFFCQCNILLICQSYTLPMFHAIRCVNSNLVALLVVLEFCLLLLCYHDN